MRDDRLAVRERFLIMRERVRATKLTKTNPERIPRSPQRPTPRASATHHQCATVAGCCAAWLVFEIQAHPREKTPMPRSGRVIVKDLADIGATQSR
jgi:hypothetical protein